MKRLVAARAGLAPQRLPAGGLLRRAPAGLVEMREEFAEDRQVIGLVFALGSTRHGVWTVLSRRA